MNPGALLMLLLAAVGAGALLCSATMLVFVWVTRHRSPDDEQERHARHAERMAAENGRPHTEAVLSRATRRDQ